MHWTAGGRGRAQRLLLALPLEPGRPALKLGSDFAELSKRTYEGEAQRKPADAGRLDRRAAGRRRRLPDVLDGRQRRRRRSRIGDGERERGKLDRSRRPASTPRWRWSARPPPVRPSPCRTDVLAAWNDNKTVVLLFVHDGGIDDKLVKAATARLRLVARGADLRRPGERDLPLRGVTEGVGVNRVPALVVVRPKHVAPDHPDRLRQLRLPERPERRPGGRSTPATRAPRSTTTREHGLAGLPEPPAAGSRTPATRPRRRSRPGCGRHPRPDAAAVPAAARAASSPTFSSISASFPKTALARRSKKRAPPGARLSSCCLTRGRSTPTSSHAPWPSATGSTTSTSPPTRSTWRRPT